MVRRSKGKHEDATMTIFSGERGGARCLGMTEISIHQVSEDDQEENRALENTKRCESVVIPKAESLRSHNLWWLGHL